MEALRTGLALIAPLALTACQPLTVRFRVFVVPTLKAKHDRFPLIWRNGVDDRAAHPR